MGRAKLPPSCIWDALRFTSVELNSMPMGPVRPHEHLQPWTSEEFSLSPLGTPACLVQAVRCWSPGTANLAPPRHWFLATWLATINSPGLEQGSRYTAGVQRMFAGCGGGCMQSFVSNKNSASFPASQDLSPLLEEGSLGTGESEVGGWAPAWLEAGLLQGTSITVVDLICKV